MRVLARDDAEHAEGGGDGVAAALYGELADVIRVEVERVWRERSPGRVLYPLINRQDGEVARAREPPVVEERLERAEDLRVAVGVRPDAVNKVRAGDLQEVA